MSSQNKNVLNGTANLSLFKRRRQNKQKGHNHDKAEGIKEVTCCHRVLNEEITQVEASEILFLSERQIRRIVSRIRREGDIGIIHKSRGKESNMKLPKKLTDRVVYLYRQRYEGFGPTLFREKLAEQESIHISDEAVRKLSIEEGLWEANLKQRTHRKWRQRSEHCGEMLQWMAVIMIGLKVEVLSVCKWHI